MVVQHFLMLYLDCILVTSKGQLKGIITIDRIGFWLGKKDDEGRGEGAAARAGPAETAWCGGDGGGWWSSKFGGCWSGGGGNAEVGSGGTSTTGPLGGRVRYMKAPTRGDSTDLMLSLPSITETPTPPPYNPAPDGAPGGGSINADPDEHERSNQAPALFTSAIQAAAIRNVPMRRLSNLGESPSAQRSVDSFV
jgi:hypothetical protein